MSQLRRVLIEWPIRLFDLWWAGYKIVLALLIMVIFSLTVIALVLDSFGIRWGW